MSSSDTTILEGPDGRLYEIPDDALESYAVPGARVVELRKQMSGGNGVSASAPAEATHGHFGPDNIPPGHPAANVPPPSVAPVAAGANQSLTIPTGAGNVTLNIYVGGPPPDVAEQPAVDTGLEGYHMSFNEIGIPVNHTEMLWGDYMDKQGNPAVGWHSHDPVTGNAQ